jgi:hypothetical protein
LAVGETGDVRHRLDRLLEVRERVRFIVRPGLGGAGGWLALREDLLVRGAEEEQLGDLRRRFAAIQVWFSDLDDFDTRSPARIIARRAVGAGYLNPAYCRWALETVYLFCRYGRKRGEAMSWKRYYDSFLKRSADEDWLKDEAFRFIDDLLTPWRISRLLFPSVREFYASFGAEKYLVTRNLERVAYRFSKVLPYSGYYHEVKDKAALVEAFIALRPEAKRYGSGGDSEEDRDVAKVLDYYYRKGRIEQPICLYRAGFPFALDRSFNVFVGRDRGALAGALASPHLTAR